MKQKPPKKPRRGRKASLYSGALSYRVKEIGSRFVYFMYGFSYIIYMTFFAAYKKLKQRGCTRAVDARPKQEVIWAMVGGLSIFWLWGEIFSFFPEPSLGSKIWFSLGLYHLSRSLCHLCLGEEIQSVSYLSGVDLWPYGMEHTHPFMAAAAGDYWDRNWLCGARFITLFFGVGQALGPAVEGYLARCHQIFLDPFLLAKRSLFRRNVFSSYLTNHHL